MQVREATVGPLSGTFAVSGVATRTRSSGRPSVSATICARVVRAPWPISVLATRMRTPRGTSSSAAREASITSPEPVKPAPWKKSERPMPRFVPRQARRLRWKSERFTASRRTASAVASSPSTWPVAIVSPGTRAFLSRRATGSRPRASATRSMCASAAKTVCGAPKPRKAPQGGVFVITTRPWTRTLSQR